MSRLTELEWWSLCAAHAAREEALDEYAAKGVNVGTDRAALRRAMDKVQARMAPPVGGQRVRRRR